MFDFGILLAILVLIAIPCLIYGFFCLLPPCPPLRNIPLFLRRLGRDSSSGSAPVEDDKIKGNSEKVMSSIKYMNKEGSLNEDDNDRNDECPVCLSVFVEEEEIKQLKTCEHIFHGVCIDKWINSHHSSCPICRAPIPLAGKRPKPRPVADDGDDFRQGLPDASSLI